jgi:cell division protein FtsQ
LQQVGPFSRSEWRPPRPQPHDAGVADRLPEYTWPTRRRRRLGRPAVQRMMTIAVAALIGGGLFWNLTQGGSQARTLDSVGGELDQIASWSGFGIDQVTLKGHRFTPDSDVFEALGLDEARSVVTFDIIAARQAVEDLPWVEQAAITRVYPDQLLVEISERAPYALWRRGERYEIVDDEGRVLSAADPKTAPEGLLQIAGEGAATEAAALTALLSSHPEISGSMQSAERVGGRRWRLHLDGGSLIDLPANGAAAALSDLKAWKGLAKLLAAGDAVIDARTPGRIAVRGAVPPTGHTAETRGIRELIMRAG